MNDDNILTTTASRLFDELANAATLSSAEEGVWPARLWDTLEEHGMTHAAVPEALGGAGAELIDAFNLLTVGASHCAPVPLAETFLAGWLLASADMQVPVGPLTVVAPGHASELVLHKQAYGWQLSGHARRVAWARHAEHVVMLTRVAGQMHVVRVLRQKCSIVPGVNMAGEPRDDLSFDVLDLGAAEVVRVDDVINHDTLNLMGAAARACQMAGALDRILHLAIEYVGARVQFGRPLAKFQAIQHQLANLAGEVAAASVAADAAARVIQQHGVAQAELEVAAAKIRTGEAAGTGAAIAHQVHGAMGFTQAYPLQFATRRLWSWRDEFGNESYWAARLGAMMLTRGGDGLWPALTCHAGIASP